MAILRCKLAAAVVAAAALAAAIPASSVALSACHGQEDFACGTLTVPLDRTGAFPGTVALHYAVERHGPKPILVALSGGPGQSAVSSATSFATTLHPALRRYRIAVFDQRGTGDSGALNCPMVQRLRSLDPFLPSALAACANLIGPRRAFYTTADTVLDLDALRQALGADKVALMGISYGTHVALQYARAFPDKVDRLILDSIVGPGNPDPFLLDTYRNMPRVLREQCLHNACRLATRDPVADVAAIVTRLNAQGPLRGIAYDARGRRRTVAYENPDQLSFLLTAGDLNPFLQAELPAAISAARRGDTSLLMRLFRIGEGGPTSVSDLSFGLNVTTGCEDVQLPYSLQTPIPVRPAVAQAALAAIPPGEYAPFDGQTVLRTSYVDDCLQWPGDVVRPPFNGPLPNVPALLLGGRLDTRTPIENAFATRLQLPQATVVALKGSGHDALDSDITGCTAKALTRFIENAPVGTPCAAKDNAVAPVPLPPSGLSDFRSAPGVGGQRGRAVFGVIDTAIDARLSVLQALFAGVQAAGGGLHGGFYNATSTFDSISLHDYSYVPGLRVTGKLSVDRGRITGTLKVRGSANGRLTLDHRGGAHGVLGGRAVRYRPARAQLSGATRVDGGRMPRLVADRSPLPSLGR